MNYPDYELSFLIDIIDEVIACRQFLKWVFVYAYLKQNIYKDVKISEDTLFICNLTKLDQTCDALHEMIENTPFNEFRKSDY